MRPTAARRPRLVVAATALTVLAGGLLAVPAGAAPVEASAGAHTTGAAPGRPLPPPPAGITCRRVDRPPVDLECVLGRSVRGRAIVAQRQGVPDADRVLVVNGQMHGEEWPGPLVVDRIRRLRLPAGVKATIWTVRTLNPDGAARSYRYTAHGVDLNANFPNKWYRPPGARYPGTAPLSEPESRAMARFLTWVQPNLVISLHGFSESVDTTGGGLRAARARQFAALTNLGPAKPVLCGGPCHGNMTDWYTATSKVGGVAFTVEMPRTSRGRRTCAVPGYSGSRVILDCTARAAVAMAARL